MNHYDSQGFANRFAHFVVNKPLQSILVAILLFLVLVPGLSRLRTDFSYRIWFMETDPLLEKFDAFERKFGNDDALAIVVHSKDGIFDLDSARLLMELTSEAWLLPEIIRVDSLTNFNWVHSQGDDIMVDPLIPEDVRLSQDFLDQRKKIALEHETIPKYLLGEDAKTAVIFANVRPMLNGTPDYTNIVLAARKMLKKFEGRGHDFYLTGGVGINHTFRETTEKDLSVLVPIVLGLIIFFLFLMFRGVGGVVFPLLVVKFSVLTTLGFSGWVGFKFNNMTSVVPQILIAIAIADAVHILATYFIFRRKGEAHKDAIRISVLKNFQPTILTSITTAFGFLSLSPAKVLPVAQLGVLAGVGTILAWLMTMLVLVPLISLIPLKVKEEKRSTRGLEASPLMTKISDILFNHRKKIVYSFVVFAIVCVSIASKNTVNSDPFRYFAERVPLSIANNFMEDNVGAPLGAEVVLDAGKPEGIKDPSFLKKVNQLQKWIDQHPEVTKTNSIVDIVKQMNRSLHGDDPTYYRVPETQDEIGQLLFLYTMSLPQGMDLNNRMSIDNDSTRLSVFWTIHDSKTNLEEHAKIISKAASLGLNAQITGKNPLYQRMNGYVVSTFIQSISIALLLISILLCVVFKSIQLGLLALIPNAVPPMLGAAVMYLMGRPIDVGAVLVWSVCLGIAVDDTIHILSNYNRHIKLGESSKEAIAKVLTYTAPALFVTTSVIVAGFSSFLFAQFVPNFNFGVLSAVVLTFALFLDLTLLPALLMWFAEIKERKGKEKGRFVSTEPAKTVGF